MKGFSSEKACREQTLGQARRILETAKEAGRRPNSREFARVWALLDTAEIVLGESCPRSPRELNIFFGI